MPKHTLFPGLTDKPSHALELARGSFFRVYRAWYICLIANPSSLNAMATITFDTHKFVRKLESAGFSSDQAEAVAEAFRDASGEAELATKRDIERLEAGIDARFERIDGELKLNRWMLGIIVVAEAAPLLTKLFQ